MTSNHGHETPEYWESIYAERLDWAIDVHLPDVVDGLEPGTAFDIGCGEGQNSRWLAERGWSVLGIDISPTAIAGAREHGSAGSRFEVGDARSWQPEGTFDLVISTYALPPAGKGRDETLTLAATSVAPGGTAYVAEFDQSTEDLWPPDDLVRVDELVRHFGEFQISRAEVITLPHQHDRHAVEWPMAILVAQRAVR